MKTIAITGSEGFIGGYVVSEALRRGYKVVGIDNFSKYGKPVRNFSDNANYTLVQSDAQDTFRLEQIFERADHVIAGAAMIGGISYFHTYPYDLLATNERIIASTCDAAIKALDKGILKKVTYLSSSMVFESTSSWPSKEGDELTIPPPISSYGFQKLSVEYFARAAWMQYRLPYTILRPFNCVGIGEVRAVSDKAIKSGEISLAMSHVLPDLVQKVLRGQNPLRLLGDGTQIRCYTYGGDLARGVLDSLENENTINRDYNLSTTQETTVLELAKLIWSKVHGNLEGFTFESDEPFIHDVAKRIPSVDKAKNDFGFEANTPIEVVLDEVIPWVTEAIKKNQI